MSNPIRMNSTKQANPNVSATVGGIKIEDTTVVLAKKEWPTVIRNGTIEQVKPIPESWFDIRNVVQNSNFHALVSCPKCKEVNAVAHQVSTIDKLGKICPRYICGYKHCRYSCEIYLDEFHDKVLYAIALQDGKRIQLQYTHAKTVEEASRGIDRRRWSVIGIGPAIGYFVDDKKGDQLSL